MDHANTAPPAEAPISDPELAAYRRHVGRSIEETDGVAADVVARLAATFDMPDAARSGTLPPLWHYGLFLPATATSALGEDGHPPRGDFLPPVRLPRRMFAGAAIRFHAPLVVGQPARKISRVAAVDLRRGRSGELVIVRVASEIMQCGACCLDEEQVLIYRGLGPPLPPVSARTPAAPSPDATVWLPTRVELFRFSAVTFNAHRIHYDRRYTTEVEGYPDLVVHGPLTAMRLCLLAWRMVGALRQFRFRAEAPLFVDQPVRLRLECADGECRLAAERCDGAVAMTATALF